MKFRAVLLAALLASPAAQAADPLPADKPSGPQTARKAPLDPGRSAGVRRAQQTQAGLALTGAAGVIAGVVLAVTSGGGGGNSQAIPQVQNNAVTTTTATTS